MSQPDQAQAVRRLGGTCASPVLKADFAGRRVGEVMITAPKTLPLDASLADVREAFEDSHVHMVLLAHNGILYGTLLRSDVPDDPATAQVMYLATLAGRTVGSDELIEPVHSRLVRSGQRRLAVVDSAGHLLGLLCLKRDQAGFCSDEGVAARALDRDHTAS